MTDSLETGIINFKSLREILELIDAKTSFYLSQKEEYSQQLGKFLRNLKEKYGEQEWFKELSLEEISEDQKKSKKKKNKGKRGRKSKKSDYWISYKGVLLSSNIQSEAEIMFDAISAIDDKLEKLKNTKTSINELKEIGLGKVIYVCFLKNGVIKNIVVKQVDIESEEKFSFDKILSVVHVLQS